VAFVQKGNTAMKGGGPTVRAGVDSTVLDESLEPVTPGSGVIGKLARGETLPEAARADFPTWLPLLFLVGFVLAVMAVAHNARRGWISRGGWTGGGWRGGPYIGGGGFGGFGGGSSGGGGGGSFGGGSFGGGGASGSW